MVRVINTPGRPAGKKINSNCERKGTSRGEAKLANFFKGNGSTTAYRAWAAAVAAAAAAAL